MGGCATKPKVFLSTKSAKARAPEPLKEEVFHVNIDHPVKEIKATEKEEEEEGEGVAVSDKLKEIVDDDKLDDQSNKRRSLSLLFKENEDGKVSSGNETTHIEEEPVKQELPESEKPCVEHETAEPIKQQGPTEVEKPPVEPEKVKQELLEVVKPSGDQTGSEEAVKQEQSEVDVLSRESASKEETEQAPAEVGKSVGECVRRELLEEEPKEVEKPSEGASEVENMSGISEREEPVKQEVKEVEKPSQEYGITEPMRQEISNVEGENEKCLGESESRTKPDKQQQSENDTDQLKPESLHGEKPCTDSETAEPDKQKTLEVEKNETAIEENHVGKVLAPAEKAVQAAIVAEDVQFDGESEEKVREETEQRRESGGVEVSKA